MNDYLVDVLLVSICVVSTLISSIIPSMYFIFKRCQGHPMKLVAFICTLEMVANYNFLLMGLSVYKYEDSLNLAQIFQFLTFNYLREPSVSRFCEINLYFFGFLEAVIIMLNICLTLDLFITLRSPFYSGKKRQRIYNVVAIAFAIPIFYFMLNDISNQCRIDQDINNLEFPDALIYEMLVFLIVALIVIALCTYELKQKKNKNNTRQTYLIHHRRTLIGLFVCWLAPCVNDFLGAIDNATIQFIAHYLAFFSLLMTSTVVNIVRLTDPFVWKNVSPSIINFFKFKYMLRCIRIGRLELPKKPSTSNNIESNPFVSAQETGEQINQKAQEPDMWNLSLNNALVQFQNQHIIQNIIQIVIQMSQGTKIEELNNTIKIEESQVSRLLNDRDIQGLTKISKIKKKVLFECHQFEEGADSVAKKTVFRRQQIENINSIRNNSAEQHQRIDDEQKVQIQAVAPGFCLFEKIRHLDDISYDILASSLDVTRNIESIKQTKESLGASGSFFFFSYDKRFVIKTISETDVEALMELLPTYYIHLLDNPHTTIAKTYGLYTVDIANITKVTFILMENSFAQFDRLGLSYNIYDMKGSVAAREVKNPNAAVFKDVNYLKSNDCFIYLKKHEKQELLEQIEKDIRILAQLNIMDYSLLLGVAKAPQEQHEVGSRANWQYMDSCKGVSKRVYSLRLIDYLQKFNCQKYMELRFKAFFRSEMQLSCIRTSAYYERFLKFLDSIILVIND